jgi:hypothetical protein
MPIEAIAAGAEAALGLGKALYGFFDNKKANKELDQLETPFYKVQDEYYQNRNLAAQQAAGGLPSATRNYLTTEAQRGLGSSIGAIEQTGGSPNGIAELLDQYNRNIEHTAAQDAQLHTGYLQEFMNRNTDVAGQKNMQFAINEYQPYENQLKQLEQRIAANKQNIFGGFSDAIGGAAAVGTATQNSDLSKAMTSFYNNGSNRSSVTGTPLNIGNEAIAPIGGMVNSDMTRMPSNFFSQPITSNDGAATFDYNSLNDADRTALWDSITSQINRR